MPREILLSTIISAYPFCAWSSQRSVLQFEKEFRSPVESHNRLHHQSRVQTNTRVHMCAHEFLDTPQSLLLECTYTVPGSQISSNSAIVFVVVIFFFNKKANCRQCIKLAWFETKEITRKLFFFPKGCFRKPLSTSGGDYAKHNSLAFWSWRSEPGQRFN